MATIPTRSTLEDPDYPSFDGEPMADNDKQFHWIVAVTGGLETAFDADPNVLVVGNMLWYPVEGDNTIRAAPDTMVILGRPKGSRRSYIQHREEGVAPQVVFEVLSPGNRAGEMRQKLAFYQRYGVEEYYVLNPDRERHRGYLRTANGKLEPLADLFGWVSPRLGIRFEMTEEIIIFGPDGRRFEFYDVEARGRRVAEAEAAANQQWAEDEQRGRAAERERANQADQQARAERERANQADRQARAESERAETERERADHAQLQAEAVAQQNERLRARLRAAGFDPDA